MLKNIIGDYTMEQIQRNSQEPTRRVLEIIAPKLLEFGLTVSLVEIENIRMPYNLQRMTDMIMQA